MFVFLIQAGVPQSAAGSSLLSSDSATNVHVNCCFLAKYIASWSSGAAPKKTSATYFMMLWFLRYFVNWVVKLNRFDFPFLLRDLIASQPPPPLDNIHLGKCLYNVFITCHRQLVDIKQFLSRVLGQQAKNFYTWYLKRWINRAANILEQEWPVVATSP